MGLSAETMEVLRPLSASQSPRKGCNPIMATQRSKMQSQRSLINKQLCKQMRIRAGAENLFNATTNAKVKETVALELSFVNSNLQLLKEELSEINSSVEPYQSKNGKTVSIPMIPLGLKDTTELEFTELFETFLSEHYGEDPNNYCDELADFADMRTSTRTPARNQDGISLLLEYYNQLYFVENRFFPPHKPLGVYFHWYDSITGVPAVQRSVSLEKASILFNIGALYSQIGTRADRTKRKGVDIAIDAYQRSAGVYNYLRANFSNSPTPDLSHSFLSALTFLMLAQAQECAMERNVLGGFEIQLGKCASIAQEAMQVAEKYDLADKAFAIDPVNAYVPYSWINMVQVKAHHYRALGHYYASLGLLEQHEAAEPVEISKLLSTLYIDVNDDDVPKPDDAARRKEDRRRLGKSHLRQAIFYHERSLQTHSLCKMVRNIDILKEYLQHAHQRSVSKFAEIDTEEDFFELIDAPNIQPYTTNACEAMPPAFGCVSSTDIFKRLGPLTVFSSHYHLGSPRSVTLANHDAICGFTLHGNSPVTVTNLDEKAKQLGMRTDDIVAAIDGIDVKWSSHCQIADLIAERRGSPVRMTLVTILGSMCTDSTTTSMINDFSGGIGSMNTNNNNSNGMMRSGDPGIPRRMNREKNRDIKKRHSFGFFQGLKLKNQKPNRFSTISETVPSHIDPLKGKRAIAIHRSATSAQDILRSGAGGTVLRQRKDLSSEYRSNC